VAARLDSRIERGAVNMPEAGVIPRPAVRSNAGNSLVMERILNSSAERRGSE
jgi:hypothetical protein